MTVFVGLPEPSPGEFEPQAVTHATVVATSTAAAGRIHRQAFANLNLRID
jgi:hypothetical protein